MNTKERSPSFTAIPALLLGVVAVSCAAILIRFSEQEIGPFATITHRFWIATVALGLWTGVKRLHQHRLNPESRPAESLSRREWGLLLLAGTISGGDLCLWGLSLTQTSVANAAVLGNLAPLFTALGMWVLWKQRFDLRFVLGLLVALAGAFTIGLEDFQLVSGHLIGDAIALLSAIFFSAYLLTVERLRIRFAATTILLVCSAIATGVSTVITLVLEDQFWPVSMQGWLAVIGLGLISQTLGQGLVAYSLSQLSSGIVAITCLLEPAIAALMAWFLFSETLNLVNGFGFTLVTLGIYAAMSSQAARQSVQADSTNENAGNPEVATSI